MKSLRIRLMTIFLVTTLPLIILLCIFGITEMNQLSRTELNTATEAAKQMIHQLESEIQGLQEKNILLQQERTDELKRLNSEGGDCPEVVWIWQAIRDLRRSCPLARAGYLRLPGKENSLRVTFDRASMNPEEALALQHDLERIDFSVFRSQRIRLMDDGHQFWIVWNVNYGNISYGILFPEQTLLRRVEQMAPGFQLQLTEGSGNDRETLQRTMAGVAVTLPIQSANLVLSGILPYAKIILPGTLLIGLAILTMLFMIPMEWKMLRREVLLPMKRIKTAMDSLESSQMHYRLEPEALSEDFSQLNQSFNHMAEEIGRLRLETYEKELEKLRVQAVNLSLQANPHLLLNSLSMIYSLSLSRNYAVIQDYTQQLISYFRYSLRNQDELVTLQSELNFVENFFRIQQIRFPNAFSGKITVDEQLKKALVPPLLIENFAENAIKHGRRAGKFLQVDISVQRQSEWMLIEIQDDGTGMSEDTLRLLNEGGLKKDEFGTHLGIWNCKKRVELFYDGNGSIKLTPREDGGTRVEIRLPICFEQKEEKDDAVNR